MKTKTLQEQIDKFYKETRYRLEVKDGKTYYGGSLDLRDTKISELPDNLVVEGRLNLYDTKITKLPDNLIVGGWLNLRYAEITQLPDNLVVGGDLDLYNTNIAKLPDNLVVGGCLNISHTKITELPENLVVGCNLELYNTRISKLPNNLVVGGDLVIYGTKITKLSKNLIVGEYLDLEDTEIDELPDNLMVGGGLYLAYTNITKLPDNLVVGGCLDINHTKITELPDNLVVGNNLYLVDSKVAELPDNNLVGGAIFGISKTPFRPTLTKEEKEKLQKIYSFIQNTKGFLQWNVGGKSYIKVDDIFSVVDNHKGNVWRTHRIGKDETLYVVTDGEGHYAHGYNLEEAKDDLLYKINDRDTSLYEKLSLDDEISFEDAVAMYRTITGACSAGTRNFVESRLPKPHKEKYSIKEIIDLTDGEYGSGTLKEFFKVSNR